MYEHRSEQRVIDIHSGKMPEPHPEPRNKKAAEMDGAIRGNDAKAQLRDGILRVPEVDQHIRGTGSTGRLMSSELGRHSRLRLDLFSSFKVCQENVDADRRRYGPDGRTQISHFDTKTAQYFFRNLFQFSIA